jgi:predicted nucleic acid-binding protein
MRTVASADRVYVDPSALARLYFTQGHSREMVAWRMRNSGPLPVTHFGRTELVNSIGLARFQNRLTASDAEAAWVLLAADFANGHLEQMDILWRAAMNRASDLSRHHTKTLGTRALDVLHVASALELGLRRFLSFDEKQVALAKAVGLKVIAIPS